MIEIMIPPSKVDAGAVAPVSVLRSQSAPDGAELRPATSTATDTDTPRDHADVASLRTRSAPVARPRHGLRDLFTWTGGEEKSGDGVPRTSEILSGMLRQGTQPVETALCPICYCNVPLQELYTVSERCGHRFCEDCLGGWITCMVNDGNVELFCPFDASMCNNDKEQAVGMWNCPTCTLSNPEHLAVCSACSVPRDKWRCSGCTFFNNRPVRLGAESKSSTGTEDAAETTAAGVNSAETVIDLEAAASLMRCSACNTEQSVLPPPAHPAASGKCGMLLTKEDVAALTSPEVVAKYERFKAHLADPNNRDCPNPQGCDHRQIGSPESPAMTCEKCGYHFCFEHSNAHPGKTCHEYEAKIRQDVLRMRQAVKAMGARPCPHCQCDTLKNSGCNHMTCSNCRKEWCWLCGRKLGRGHESVSRHYDPRNVLGCGGMQMDYGATPGCVAVTLRRILHFLHMLVAGILAFVCCVLGGLTFVGICCTVCLPCFCFATKDGSKTDAMLKIGAGFTLFYGAIPAACCLLVSFFFGVALNVALLPLTLLGAVWSFSCGDAGADRIEIRNDRATAPMSKCEIILRIVFMPFIVNFEELKLLTGQQN